MNEPPARSESRRGRAARQAQASSNGRLAQPAFITRRIPHYNLLDEEALCTIEAQADWLLKEIGIDFPGDEEALRLFRGAGATVTGSRVRFDPGHLESLCATAPSSFRMEGRQPGRAITIGGDHLVFKPSYGPPFVTDLDQGRRYATIEDFRNIVKLTESSPWLHHSGGTLCEPVDLPVNKRHLQMVYAHLRYSSKPFMGSVSAPERAEDSIAMARLVYGSDFLERNCVIQGNINVNSPLVYDDVMSGALKTYAKANQSVVVSSFILAGAMAPVTQPAVLAQALAEVMTGIALSQLVRPGAPAVYGSFLTTMNLQTGAPTFGTPESHLAAMAFAQLGRRRNLPLRVGGHLTASKIADGQAMQESASGMMAGIMAGTNMVFHAAGWLEGGLTFGYEKFALDLDHCGMMQRMLDGLTIDDNSLASEAYREAGPGKNHLGTVHTLKNFRSANYASDLADTRSFETWSEAGAPDAAQRANARWKAMLRNYEAPAFDPAIDEALKDFVARKEREAPDLWH